MSVELRKLQISDAALFAELANDMRIAENTSDRFPHPYNETDAQRFIDMHQDESNASVFGILFNGDLVGGIGLHFRADIYRKTAELGYWVNPKFWGKGIATKAITKILDYGFSNLDVAVVVAHVFGRNAASQHILIKQNFTRLGVIPNGAYKLGKYEDDVIFYKENPNF